jgi:MFS family permease
VEGAVVNEVSPGPVIGRAWDIYKSQFATLIVAAAIVSLINLLATFLLGPFAGIISLIVSLFFVGAVVHLVKDLDDGRRDEELSSLFAGVGPVFWQLLAVAILAGIGIAIGLVLLIIPGLILITLWAVAVPVVVLEKPGVFASFGRSRELVRGHGWPVFGTLVVTWLITIGVAIVGGIIVTLLDGADIVQAIVNWLLSALLLPITALVISVLYFRLRAVHGEVRTGAPAVEPTDWQQPAT